MEGWGRRLKGFEPHNWYGLVAAILAIAVLAAVLGLSIGLHHMTAEEATAFSTVVGAIIGALATFLGITTRGDGDDKDH